ncbi:MAG: glycosyltransferase [Candidatus Roizmanbacteria bacterium]|nr:glycosyltransferase [Candidatus Roizmanbacteria bacterium]
MKNHTKKRIAFFLFSLAGGGAERAIVNLIKSPLMKKFSIELILIKPVDDFGLHSRMTPRYVQIHSLIRSTGKIHPFILPIIALVIICRLIVRMVSNDYHLVIGVNEYLPYILTYVASRLKRIPFIIIVGNNLEQLNAEQPKYLQHIYWQMLSIPIRYANKIICSSEGLKKSIISIFNITENDIEVIYPISPPSNKMAPSMRQKKSSIFTILSVGRLERQKGHIHLIRAFSFLSKKFPHARLIICGKGKEHGRLIEAIHYYKLRKKVLLSGFQTDISTYLRKAHLFVFPSLYEGFGMALFEAVEAGLPVVSTDCAYGPREILSNLPIQGPYESVKKNYIIPGGILIPAFTQSAFLEKHLTGEEKRLVEALTQSIRFRKINRYHPPFSMTYANFIRQFNTIFRSMLQL